MRSASFADRVEAFDSSWVMLRRRSGFDPEEARRVEGFRARDGPNLKRFGLFFYDPELNLQSWSQQLESVAWKTCIA